MAVVEVGIMVGIGYLFGASSELAEELRWIQLAIAVFLTIVLVVAPILAKRRIERRQSAA